jgi:hypothetical protein
MKRVSLALLLALVTLGAVSSGAHANQGIFATWWNLDESNSDGFGFGFRSKIQVVPIFSFDTRVSWIKFGDSDMSVYPIEATGMLKLGMVYAGAGAGYYFFDSNDVDVDNNFGWYAVGGIDLSLGSFGVFGEVKWTSLSTDAKDLDPDIGDIPLSLDADGIGFNLGVMFGLPGR